MSATLGHHQRFVFAHVGRRSPDRAPLDSYRLCRFARAVAEARKRARVRVRLDRNVQNEAMETMREISR